MEKLKLRAGIMASASSHMMPVAVVGAIPLAIYHYGSSPTLMQTVFALPALTAVPMSLIIGSLAGKTGKKIPLQAGTVAMLLGGLAVALFDLPLAGLIAAMSVIGLGLGCVMTLSAGLIADHFQGAEQSKGMAHIAAFANLGGMVLAAVAGVLMTSGWRPAFLTFAYAAAVFIIVQIFLPKDRPYGQKANEGKTKIKLNAQVFIICGMVFFMGQSFGIRNANAGLLVVEHGLGDVAAANYATTFWTAVGIIMGFAYGFVAKALKKTLLPVFLGLFAIGMVLMGNAAALWVFYLGNILAGMGIATAMPTLIAKSAQSVDPASSTFVISMVFATMNISNFTAPMIVNNIARFIASETAQACFNIGAVLMAALCVFSWFYVYRQPPKWGFRRLP